MTDSTPEKIRKLTRRELYDMVWSTPVRTLAKSFGVSDVWLGKMCRECGVPTPRPGYWAKKRAGKRVQRRGLPKNLDPDEVVVTWDPEATQEKREPKPAPTYDEDIERAIELAASLPPIEVADTLSKPHRLVARTRQILRARDRERNLPFHARRHDSIVDESTPFHLNVGEEARDRVLKILDALARGFVAAGHKLNVTESQRDGTARIQVLGEEFKVLIRERLRQRPYDPKVDGEESPWFRPKVVREPTGRLILTLECDSESGVHRSWQDTKTRTVESVLNQVVRTTAQLVQNARGLREARRVARERRAEEERRRLERDREERAKANRRRIEKMRAEILMEKASDWARADQLRRFAAACREAADDQTESQEADWLRWVDDVVKQVDPLTRGLASLVSATSTSVVAGNCM